MSTDQRAAAAYVLVENGMHRGARLELREPGTWYAAGGQVDADYWLADPDLAEAKALFALIDGSVRVRIEAGPAAAIDGAVLDAGGEAVLRRSLLWGGVSFRGVAMPLETGTATPQPAVATPTALAAALAARVPRRAGLWLLATLALAVPLGLVLVLLSSLLERVEQRERQAKAIAAQSGPDMKRAQARAAAQRMADLIGVRTVNVSALDGETLALYGSNVPPEQREAIQAAVAQFEPHFKVRDNIVYRDDRPPPPVELARLPDGVDFVQYGSDGFLRGRNGSLYLVGAKLPDGTQIEDIGETQISFSRGHERAVLRAHFDDEN